MPDSQPDFIALAGAARPEGPREALDRLWSALFSLPAWLFLMTPRSAETLQPSVQSIDGKPWMLVFTDSSLLRTYATQNRNLDSKGEALYLSMEPGKALSYLSSYKEEELFGLRFNERAAHGWFSPLASLPRIHAHLKQNGLLETDLMPIFLIQRSGESGSKGGGRLLKPFAPAKVRKNGGYPLCGEEAGVTLREARLLWADAPISEGGWVPLSVESGQSMDF